MFFSLSGSLSFCICDEGFSKIRTTAILGIVQAMLSSSFKPLPRADLTQWTSCALQQLLTTRLLIQSYSPIEFTFRLRSPGVPSEVPEMVSEPIFLSAPSYIEFDSLDEFPVAITSQGGCVVQIWNSPSSEIFDKSGFTETYVYFAHQSSCLPSSESTQSDPFYFIAE
ncbi:putative matrix protein [Atrato Rhabdo-like virus 3]|uniref:Putative matrix protein n=1 Tax=Atrato Rhabdo-like virus 3 TaxID=2689335 RepID=A0A6B9KGJ6_9RHAB|nr:putative matrix protein [Atrato Rhabdo-like virus 3]